MAKAAVNGARRLGCFCSLRPPLGLKSKGKNESKPGGEWSQLHHPCSSLLSYCTPSDLNSVHPERSDMKDRPQARAAFLVGTPLFPPLHPSIYSWE